MAATPDSTNSDISLHCEVWTIATHTSSKPPSLRPTWCDHPRSLHRLAQRPEKSLYWMLSTYIANRGLQPFPHTTAIVPHMRLQHISPPLQVSLFLQTAHRQSQHTCILQWIWHELKTPFRAVFSPRLKLRPVWPLSPLLYLQPHQNSRQAIWLLAALISAVVPGNQEFSCRCVLEFCIIVI